MKINFVNLSAQWKVEKKKLLPKIIKILNSGQYIGGSEVKKFEKKISKVCNTKYAVALNSGTDALVIGLKLLGVKRGDEVITPPNSFISSTTSIWHVGAKPVFVDVNEDLNINVNLIEKSISKKTKAIMPVHLTGRICDMKFLKKISKRYKIPIIEDAAQSIGSKYFGKKSGSFGDIACFSAHPLKNLNACGDAGFLVTNNKQFYDKAIKMRNHGLENRNVVKNFGFISRMDSLQASILNYRIKMLNKTINIRKKNAKFYLKNIDQEFYDVPKDEKYQFNSYHTFIIKSPLRDALKKYLNDHLIETAIHYPIPIHLQPACNYLGYKKGSFPVTEKLAKKILTLPIHQYLSKNQLKKIVYHLNNFAKRNKK